jgi:segregation and condensation protein B
MATRKTREQLDAEMDQLLPAGQPEQETEPLAGGPGKELTGASEGASEEESFEVSEEASEKASVEGSEEVAEEGLGEACDGGQEGALDEEQEEAFDEAAEEAAEEGVAGVSEEITDEIFEEPVEDVLEDLIEPDPMLTSNGPVADSQAAGLVEDDDDEGQTGPVDPALASRVKAALESLLFAAAEPVSFQRLAAVVRDLHPGFSNKALRGLLELLRDELREQGRGVRVAEVAGSYQLRTPSEAGPYVRKLVTTRPPRLTRATLETLAIVAYRQPITRPEVEEIRGVDCGAVLKHLLDRRLVKILGRKEEVGRPLLYATAAGFLEFFGLKDLKSLPTLKDFVELSDEHRAQLGLEPPAEDKPVRQREERLLTDDLLPEPTDAWAPVGTDEVIEELAEALEDVRRRDRQLRQSGALPPDRKPPTQPVAEGEGAGEGEAVTEPTESAQPAPGSKLDPDSESEMEPEMEPETETDPDGDPSEDDEDGS